MEFWNIFFLFSAHSDFILPLTTIELFQFQGIFTVDFTSESGTSAQQTPSGNLLKGIDNEIIKRLGNFNFITNVLFSVKQV